MIALLSAFAQLIAQAAEGVNLTPILAAIGGGMFGAGGVGWFVRRSTNKQLDAQGEKLYQEALEAAEKRGQSAIATVERVREVIEADLERTRAELEQTRQQLRVVQEKLEAAEERAKAMRAERDLVVEEARRERETLQRRVLELEERVVDLSELANDRRRRRDTS